MKAVDFLEQITFYGTDYQNWQIWDFSKQFCNAVEWIIRESTDIEKLSKSLFDAKHLLIIWPEFDQNGNTEKEYNYQEEPDGIATLRGYENKCHFYVIE